MWWCVKVLVRCGFLFGENFGVLFVKFECLESGEEER